jgi:DNA damage-inducible protein 1
MLLMIVVFVCCNSIMRLIDKRFAGIAKGVGTSKIIGRVHGVKVKFGKTVFLSSFTILENQDMDFLFGLDQLRKHQASIDLKDNALKLQGEVVPFLAEKDLPSHIRGEDSHAGTGSTGGSSGSNVRGPQPSRANVPVVTTPSPSPPPARTTPPTPSPPPPQTSPPPQPTTTTTPISRHVPSTTPVPIAAPRATPPVSTPVPAKQASAAAAPAKAATGPSGGSVSGQKRPRSDSPPPSSSSQSSLPPQSQPAHGASLSLFYHKHLPSLVI